MADNTAGYLALEIKIDDSNVAAEIAEASGKAQAQLNRLGGSMGKYSAATQDALRHQKALSQAAQEAHARFGVMANATVGLSTAVRLLGVESGLAAVEGGRLVLYFGRAITSGGGVAAMFGTIAAAIRGFLLSIGPVGWILGATVIAYGIYSKATQSAEEATNKLSKAAEELTEAWKKAAGELAVIDGLLTSIDIRRFALQDKFADVIAAEKEKQRPGIAERIGGLIVPDPFAELRQTPSSRTPTQKKIDDILLKEEQIRVEKINRSIYERTQALRLESSILRGEGTQYDLIADAAERVATQERDRLKTLKELQNQRSELIERAVSETAGFGITTRESGGFRFGPGAVGSVIGEQSESKKTNELLGKIDAKLNELRIVGRALTESTSEQ